MLALQIAPIRSRANYPELAPGNRHLLTMPAGDQGSSQGRLSRGNSLSGG